MLAPHLGPLLRTGITELRLSLQRVWKLPSDSHPPRSERRSSLLPQQLLEPIKSEKSVTADMQRPSPTVHLRLNHEKHLTMWETNCIQITVTGLPLENYLKQLKILTAGEGQRMSLDEQ